MEDWDESPIQRVNIRQVPPIAALVSGPTNAIQNSTFALRGFFSICETPPKAKSVISFTGRPFDVATKLVKKKRHEEQDRRPNRHGRDDAIPPLGIACMELV